MRLKDLGTKDRPMRISASAMFSTCEGFAMIRALRYDLYGDEAGQAALNGSAIGLAIERWHKGDVDPFGFARREPKMKGAEWEKLEPLYLGYTNDPRNAASPAFPGIGAVDPESMEREVFWNYKDCYFSGHPDQVREWEGRRFVWDTKLSRYPGSQLVNQYAPQLALYALATDSEPGGIIRLGDYGNGGQVFYPVSWTRAEATALALQIVGKIRRVRKGHVYYCPGLHCDYCDGGGFGSCARRLSELRGLTPVKRRPPSAKVLRALAGIEGMTC